MEPMKNHFSNSLAIQNDKGSCGFVRNNKYYKINYFSLFSFEGGNHCVFE